MRESFTKEVLQKELTWDAVNEAIRNAYQEVAAERGEESSKAYYSPWCELVTDKLKEKLARYSAKVESINYFGWDITGHEFLSIGIGGEEWIVDTTWQQFLDEPDPNKPQWFKVQQNELDEKLDELGVPESKRHIWKVALQQQQKLRETKNEHL